MDKVGEIAIPYDDRLTRFGQEYLEILFACFDVTFTVLEPGEEKTPEQELTHDLLALIASFSGRMYGMRSHKQQALVACAKQVLQKGRREVAKTQTLSFPIRLPDAMQAEALRLLDASRSAINQMITELWPQLDLFASERTGPAWKQVERHLVTRSGHGSRQERCEMEQAGRILRAQASRKQVFETILPLLSEGLIRPAEGKTARQKRLSADQRAGRAPCARRCRTLGRC